MKHALTWMGLVLGGALLSGCFVAVDHGDGDPYATLTVEWLIDGTSDPDQCVESGSRRGSVVVWERSHVVEEITADCRDFGVDIDLPPGRYWVTVQLLDAGYRQRTVEVDTDDIELWSGEYESITVDFPPDSFLRN